LLIKSITIKGEDIMNVYMNNIITNTNTISEVIDLYVNKYKNNIDKNYMTNIFAYTNSYNFDLNESIRNKEFEAINKMKNKIKMLEMTDMVNEDTILIYDNIPFSFKFKTQFVDGRNLDILTIGNNFVEHEIVICEYAKEDK
jgi:hypothetical protein